MTATGNRRHPNRPVNDSGVLSSARLLVVLLAGCMLTSSCWMPARSKPVLPPPPAPSSNLPVQTTPAPRIEPPPEIVLPDMPEEAQQEPPHFPKHAEPAAPAQVPRTAPPALVGPPTPAGAPDPPPVPELTPMMSDNERRAYGAAIDELLSRVGQNIAAARRRSLDSRRRDLLSRAETFTAQARELRERDPAGAKSLAERAELLSREAAER